MPRPYEGHLLTEEQKKLVEENMNYVWYYYKKYISKRIKMNETDKEELISALYFGLCLAAEKYDPKKGKFSTIANWYLRSEVSNYFRQKKIVNERYFLTPFIFDEDIDNENSHLHSVVENFVQFTKGGEIKDNSMFDSKLSYKIKWEYIEDIIKKSNLDISEETIVKLYYKNSYNYRDISKNMQLTPERIRQICSTAMQKIRRFMNANNIQKTDIIVK